MTKNTMMALVSFLNGETIDNLDEIRVELEKEINRGAEKAQANRELYATAHDIVMNAFDNMNVAVTIAELYEEVKDELPEGFSKGKVQYALTHYWNDEIVRTEGKPSMYAKRG